MAAHNRTVPVAFDWPATLALVEHAYGAAAQLTGRQPLPLPVPSAHRLDPDVPEPLTDPRRLRL
jgi:hypothetical protein